MKTNIKRPVMLVNNKSLASSPCTCKCSGKAGGGGGSYK